MRHHPRSQAENLEEVQQRLEDLGIPYVKQTIVENGVQVQQVEPWEGAGEVVFSGIQPASLQGVLLRSACHATGSHAHPLRTSFPVFHTLLFWPLYLCRCFSTTPTTTASRQVGGRRGGGEEGQGGSSVLSYPVAICSSQVSLQVACRCGAQHA